MSRRSRQVSHTTGCPEHKWSEASMLHIKNSLFICLLNSVSSLHSCIYLVLVQCDSNCKRMLIPCI